jgi:hypothetical protein
VEEQKGMARGATARRGVIGNEGEGLGKTFMHHDREKSSGKQLS